MSTWLRSARSAGHRSGRDRRARRSRPARALVLISCLNALAALGGAVGLASGTLDLSGTAVARLPGRSTALAAVALVLAVVVPNAVVAVLVLRGDRRAGAAAMATGLVLVAWILLELAVLRQTSLLHPLYVAVGLGMTVLGHQLQEGSRHRPG